MAASAVRLVSCGTLSSRTMIVMMMANTPSLNASSLPLCMSGWETDGLVGRGDQKGSWPNRRVSGRQRGTRHRQHAQVVGGRVVQRAQVGVKDVDLATGGFFGVGHLQLAALRDDHEAVNDFRFAATHAGGSAE